MCFRACLPVSPFTHFFLLLGGIQVFISFKINLALQK
jgi:hypothetical protein